ncbi:uncharacterized protein LOC129573873 [Sitodiplosis mosellana]|uniref:uncharacterized protein LOC129573873 n=1 Tax=Sitodiplosis mosellana TaxID=263140 RepID=UPI00244462A1|nr:uncharacterized protein LOC129573873 [Sitodiplosis mosellana]
MNKEPDFTYQERHEVLMNHVILPRYLPQERSKNFHNEELALLSNMVENVERLAKSLPRNTVNMFHGLARVHKTLTPSVVSTEIRNLKPGDTFAMFVRRQNCAMMIHMPPERGDDRVIAAIFPGNLHPKHISAAESDIEFHYPVQALKVPYSNMMRSEDFADQLCFLFQELPIQKNETPNRNYVSQWLITLLADADSETVEEDAFPVITKKIRDEVLGEDKSNFFRRSSFYMCLKVFLQHSLTVELGPEPAKLLYKIVMMQFITQMVDFFNKPDCTTLNTDLMSQALAKLAQRIEKLNHLMGQSNCDQFNELSERVVFQAKETIDKIRQKIDDQIHKLQKGDEDKAQLTQLIDLDFEADIRQKIPQLSLHLESRLCEKIPNRFGSGLQIKPINRHYLDQTNAPNVTSFGMVNNEIESSLIWSDFENWVLYTLNSEENRFNPDDIRNWSSCYAKFAEEFYKNDQLGTSKMVLVRLKLIAVLDLNACNAHPLLVKHRSGIEPKIIDSLLIPQKQDMEIAYELGRYFGERNSKATDPGLIEETSITVKSFSAIFAAQNERMQQVLEEIMEVEKKGIEAKQQEWERGRERVAKLRRDIPAVCSYYTNYYGNTHHDKYCARCRITQEIQNVKIQQYERPLPKHSYEKHAVVFELKSPIEIACLRDVLIGFAKFCGGQSDKRMDIKGNWINYHQISHMNASKSKQNHLGSTAKPNLHLYHVDSAFDSFVVENAYNCVFNANEQELPPSISDGHIKKICTLKIDEDEYSGLQWTLNGTKHFQNEVIARQKECPQLLSLSEFKNFGSLRADGHRLQLRKMYAMIESEALSCEKSSVLSLIIQTLWETGVSGDGGSIRESHTDFDDSQFAAAMIEMLRKFCEQQKNNWVHPMKLLMAAFIAVRVFEINSDGSLVDQIVGLLKDIRAIALDWIDKIEEAINDIKNPNLSSEQELRIKLVFVAIAGAVTFFVHFKHKYFERIFVDNQRVLSKKEERFSAPRVWLQFVVTLSNNVLLNAKQGQFSSNLRMFLRLVRNTGIHIESTIRPMIDQNPSDVFALVKQQWTRSASGTFDQTYFHPKCPQIYVTHVSIKNIKNYVTIDLVTGSFLVNNLPVARLPNNITQSVLFQRVFGDFIFEVQPDSQNSFSAVHKYNECSYEFRRVGSGTVIIEQQNGVERELIPHSILDDEIPHHLIDSYSHFWNKTDNVIEFRPKLFSDANFSKEDGIEYRLDLQEKRLIHIKTQRYMLDINSNSYLKIVDQLSRLESPKYIHVLMDKDNSQIAKAELIRMHLKFVVDCSTSHETYDLISNEYSRMRVSLAQKCGTLYGLQHGLLLESVPCENSFEKVSTRKTLTKLLLIPHGNIRIERSQSHVSVEINIESDLYNPPFHVYQVDDFCRQLKASSSSYSAWFYLAYLHAVTSHGQVEPFIKMSGTERALQILQSGFTWSSAPYDAESTKMLQLIAQLSPERKTEESCQQVTWPNFIPPHSAQDTFVFIAQQLFEDSQRLHGLHFETQKFQLKIETQLSQNKRQYLRCLSLMPNLKVSDTFLHYETPKTSSINMSQFSICSQTQTVSNLYHRRAYKVPTDLDLPQFLMENKTLDGTANMESVKNLLKHKTYEKFVDLWIPLYEYARHGKLNDEQFALIWSVLTHEEQSFSPILALQAISKQAHVFKSIDPPKVGQFILREGNYSASKASSILERYRSLPAGYYSDEFDRDRYNARMKREIDNLTDIVTSKWPCDDIDLQPHCNEADINIRSASTALSQNLKIWNNNRKLGIFVDNVQQTLISLNGSISIQLPFFQALTVPKTINWEKYAINFKQKMCERIGDFPNEIKEAKQIWFGTKQPNKSSDEWWSIYKKIVNGLNSQHLIKAGMYPRAVPSLVVPQITSKGNSDLKAIVGALAITIAHEQREKRIEIYSQQEQLKVALEKEIENKPHENWKPCDYPAWLLFEIEQNLTIRRVQVDVANHMMNPSQNEGADDKKKHSVMQLNMGEGKTAVIAPIIAAVLANGKQACQITVLKSLFATNLKSYRRYLGGMLNRRMYVFPCRRDMPIANFVDQMMSIYEECKQMKGVILTTPEWRLSFQLKTYESIQKSEYGSAEHFLDVLKWTNMNVRSILDESDAILQAKYQLIYTLGNQLPLDGGAHRWMVIQAVLKRVPHHMKKLNAELGSEKVEFDEKYIEKGHVFGAPAVDYRSDVFTPCRILDETVFDVLKSYLIEDFLNGNIKISFTEMPPSAKEGLRQLLSEKNINKEKFEEILKDFSLSERNIIMVMCGLLRFEVLKLILKRRWRVNYGVNEKGIRKMAIPFKAKDVAADMTEFGHADVALCFTHMSYYYSGLSDDQLKHTFNLLSVSQDANGIYQKWADSVSPKLIDVSIRTYTGVNLSDPQQREEKLFPVYRFNMHVIDYFLSKVVFPREAKTFEKKLMCTAWDLCSDHMNHPVTGFSGTNDTKNILPLPIAQNDLPELESTNEDVRQTLLRTENQDYEGLPENVSGTEIIERLVEREIPVLLDSGALMLELNNLEVAKKWLELAPNNSFDAAIYLDSRDILQTIDRNGVITDFDCSVYRENLGRCLVYLDDVHTRGTDLKFPPNWRACVTLSGDITRDKTVQACMRMRQLGKDGGHSIAFWASFEADVKIRKFCEFALPHNCLPNDHVIEFICKNSENFETENTVHWAAGAYNYTQKLVGHKLHEHLSDEVSLTSLLSTCVDNEYVKLEEIYGDKEDARLVDIAKGKFDKLIESFRPALKNEETRNKVIPFIETIQEAVRGKIMKHAPNVKRFVQALDEEQEKELEHELEEQRHVERPAAMNPAKPEFDEQLKKLVLSGVDIVTIADLMIRGTLVSLANGLDKTQLIQEYVSDSDAWSNNLLVTKDFVQVLSNLSYARDEYLRPVWWIARVNTPGSDDYILVLLSSFECDRLISTFRESQQSVLCMYRSRLSKLHDNLLHQTNLQVTGMTEQIPPINVCDEVQIGIFSGSMYFNNEAEQNAYCSFLGVIPRPRTEEQEEAFNKGVIKPNGYVTAENRSHSKAISEAVTACKFNKNPVDLAIKLTEAHHHLIRKESHVASILERGFKMPITENSTD